MISQSRVCALCVFLSYSSVTYAQTIQTSSNQDLATTANIGLRAGRRSQVEAYADFIIPGWHDTNNHLFLNPRFLLANEGGNQINIGLAYRHLFDNKGILGANLYYDSRESGFGNRFEQIGLGFEWLSNFLDLRANIYNAQDNVQLANDFETGEDQVQTQTQTNRSVTSNIQITADEPEFKGHAIVQSGQQTLTTTTTTRTTTRTTTTNTNRTFEQYEGALDGWDAEIGIKLPIKTGPEVRLFGGYYSYDHPFDSDDISGAKARLEIRSGQYLSFDAEVFEESFARNNNGSDYFIGVRLEVPLIGKNTWKNVTNNLFRKSNRSLQDRLRSEMVLRDVRILTEISAPKENLDKRKVVSKTSTQTKTETSTSTQTTQIEAILKDNITFVDSDNSSVSEDGTVENPYITVATGVSNAEADTTIFVCEAGGDICSLNGGGGTYDENVNRSGINLKAGQTITSSIKFTDISGAARELATLNRPNITNSTQRSRSGLINTNQSGNTVNRLALFVNSFGGYGIYNNGFNSSGSTPTLISITDNTITASARSTVGINTIFNSSNINMSNNTITANEGFVSGVGSGNVNINFNNNTVNTVGIGFRTSSNVGTININNNTVSSTLDDGISNSSNSGTINVNNNQVTARDGGIRMSSNSGNFNANNNTINTQRGNGVSIFDTDATSIINVRGNTIVSERRTGINISGNEGVVNVSSNSVSSGDTALNTFSNEGSINVSNNTLTSTSTRADAINNASNEGTVNITSNTITANDDGINNFNNDGTINIINNSITAGDEGIFTIFGSGTVNSSGNTIN